MAVDPADLLLWSELRAQVDEHDPVPAAVLADAYACLQWQAGPPGGIDQPEAGRERPAAPSGGAGPDPADPRG